MSPALTPDLALEYLRELSADVRDGIVMDRRGGVRLAGEPALEPAARELVAEMGVAAEAEGRGRSGVVLAVRAGDLAIVLVCGPCVLPALARHDLRLALGDMEAAVGPGEATTTVPAAVVERLLNAARRGAGDGPAYAG